MNFYRYETVEYASFDTDGEYGNPKFPNPKLELRTYNLHKETPKGYWIGYGTVGEHHFRGVSRWVSKTGKKRYAYPTKEEALTAFIKRTECRTKILTWQVDVCKIALNLAEGERRSLNV